MLTLILNMFTPYYTCLVLHIIVLKSGHKIRALDRNAFLDAVVVVIVW